MLTLLDFLGDEYVEVTPIPTSAGKLGAQSDEIAPFLKDGDTVQCCSGHSTCLRRFSPPRVCSTRRARRSKTSIKRSQTSTRTVLSDQTLYDFSLAISNFASVTGIAIKTVQGADDLVASNTPAITAMVTNLEAVSEKFNVMADQLDQIIVTNRGDINDAVKNLRDTTASFKQLAAGLEAGNGLAGSLLKDDVMKAQAGSLISNAEFRRRPVRRFRQQPQSTNGLWSLALETQTAEEKETSESNTARLTDLKRPT